MKTTVNNVVIVLLVCASFIFLSQESLFAYVRAKPVDYYQQGLNYLNSGDYRNAVNSFNNAISSNPNNIDAYVSRAAAHEKMGNLSAAASDLTNVINRNPTHTAAIQNRAQLYQRMGRTMDALQDYSVVLSREPSNVAALVGRADIYRQQNNLAGALQDFKAARDRDPKNAAAVNGCLSICQVLLSQANNYRAQNNVTAALNNIQAILGADPANAGALILRGNIYQQQQQFGLALIDFKAALDSQPNNAAAKGAYQSGYYNLLNRAVYAVQQNRVDAALVDFTDILKVEPKNVTVLLQCADLYAKKGQAAEALSACAKAIEAQPNNASAYVKMGQLLFTQGSAAEASACFNKAKEFGVNTAELDRSINACANMQALGEVARALGQIIGGEQVQITYDQATNTYTGRVFSENNSQVGSFTARATDAGGIYVRMTGGNGAVAAEASGQLNAAGTFGFQIFNCPVKPFLNGSRYDGDMSDPTVDVAEMVSDRMLGAEAERLFSDVQSGSYAAFDKAVQNLAVAQVEYQAVKTSVAGLQTLEQVLTQKLNATNQKAAAQTVINAADSRTRALNEKNAATIAYNTFVRDHPAPSETIQVQIGTTRVRSGFSYQTVPVYGSVPNPAYADYQQQLAPRKTAMDTANANYDRVVQLTASVLTGTQEQINQKVAQAQAIVTQCSQKISECDNKLQSFVTTGLVQADAVTATNPARLQEILARTSADLQRENAKLTIAGDKVQQAIAAKDEANPANRMAALMQVRGLQVCTDAARAIAQGMMPGSQVKLTYNTEKQVYEGVIMNKGAELGKITGTVEKSGSALGNFTVTATDSVKGGTVLATASGNVQPNGTYNGVINSPNTNLAGAQVSGGNVNAVNRSFKQVVSAKMQPILRGQAAQRAKVAAVLDKAISQNAQMSRTSEQLPEGVQTTSKAPVGSATAETQQQRQQ